MSDRNIGAVKPIWMKQAEENRQPVASSDREGDEEDLANKPVGPVDPLKCTAVGTGVACGTAFVPSSFVVVTKDSDGRKVLTGGALIKVKVMPGVGVGGSEQEGIVKDMGDGTYMVTYVPKRGNYMVVVECNGRGIMGSPFPVSFNAGNTTGGLFGLAPQANFLNLVNQTMPNLPNYSDPASGAFPLFLGMLPGRIVAGPSGGAVLPGIGASLGEICREHLNGRCAKTDCKYSHPPHSLLVTVIGAISMGTLRQAPMAPSAAAMAAAQAIFAAQALQAHAAQALVAAQTLQAHAAQAQAYSARESPAQALQAHAAQAIVAATLQAHAAQAQAYSARESPAQALQAHAAQAIVAAQALQAHAAQAQVYSARESPGSTEKGRADSFPDGTGNDDEEANK